MVSTIGLQPVSMSSILIFSTKLGVLAKWEGRSLQNFYDCVRFTDTPPKSNMELWRKRSARKTENLEVGVRLPEVPPTDIFTILTKVEVM